MIDKEIARVEALLVSSIQHARDSGYEVKPFRTFDVNGKRCCAVGSVLVGRQLSQVISLLNESAVVIGIHAHDAINIARGFDHQLPVAESDSKWHNLGIKLWKEFY